MNSARSTGLPFVIMEICGWLNLATIGTGGGKLSPQRSASDCCSLKICEDDPVAHNEGIVHRDIKPENILLD